ncbi:MAG: isoprenyl synthetase [Bacteroidetes bacterium RBG_13_46_8]|nr:MAG: isoprenyl synthetase [Bacteroidetes bacterium RBG_13_46_8]
MYSIEDCQNIINKRFASLDLPEIPANLYDPVRYMIDLGGKRIRPSLVLMGCNVFTDKIEEAVNPAIAIEMFHNFTLMHDDIMDRSDLRRNKATVHKKWNENIGILSGDAMLIKAYEFIARCPAERMTEILKVFNTTALEVCEGQQYDMDFESSADVEIKDYLQMIELKTAVLLAASLKIGALIAGSPADDAERLYEFGRNLGIAFQLQDDLLDVYGSPERFGKQKGNDIVANKKTFLLLTALSIARGDMLAAMRHWMERKRFDRSEKIRAITAVFDELNIREITTNKITSFYEDAYRSFMEVRCDTARKQPLIHFVRSMMDREK